MAITALYVNTCNLNNL